MNEKSTTIPSLKERLWNWLNPYRLCRFPEAPLTKEYHDGPTVITRCKLDIFDRLKILITGKCEVESRSIQIGRHSSGDHYWISESVFRPLPPWIFIPEPPEVADE